MLLRAPSVLELQFHRPPPPLVPPRCVRVGASHTPPRWIPACLHDVEDVSPGGAGVGAGVTAAGTEGLARVAGGLAVEGRGTAEGRGPAGAGGRPEGENWRMRALRVRIV